MVADCKTCNLGALHMLNMPKVFLTPDFLVECLAGESGLNISLRIQNPKSVPAFAQARHFFCNLI